MINVTPTAIEKVKEISLSEEMGHFTIRVRIIGGGCAGMSYDMYFDDKVTDMDEVLEIDGIKIIIDPLSFQYLDEATMDYLEGPISAGFKFINPNVKSTCGCGSSVGF